METGAPPTRADALNHAWNWFEYHANQRMTMIRFYLTVAGAIATGVGYLWIHNEPGLSAALSSFGVVASLCFMRLDQRVSSLVKLGEDALKIEQSKFSRQLNTKTFDICSAAGDLRNADQSRKFVFPYTYGENFRVMFGFSAVLFAAMILLNLFQSK